MADLECVTWGPLDEGRHAHMDCVVVVTRETLRNVIPEQVRELAAGSLPIVCPCECLVCKRAWWSAGRPIVRDGKVVTSRG